MGEEPTEEPRMPEDVEVWEIDHPELGQLRVCMGRAERLREIDPGFPTEDNEESEDSEGGSEEDSTDNAAAARKIAAEAEKKGKGKQARLLNFLAGISEGTPAVLVTRDEAVVARYAQLDERKIPLDKKAAEKLEEGSYTLNITTPSRPRLVMDTGFWDGWVKSIYVQDAHGGTVDIIPPEGSRAQKYYRAMEQSPWKRLVYPLLGGMGKAGWAVGVLVLGPLISRLISWLLSLFPDVSLPSIPMPDISLPSISLPSISLPSIPWLDIPWPDISLPSITVPEWVKVIVEHEKIWLPLLVGLVVGVISLRRARKARSTRQRWSGAEGDSVAYESEEPGEEKPEEK
ncbi:hypothetical protein [Corynebacterium sp. 21KM1197]|uniref:hypothetical protein n=1 Tax=Corynebacterium sp. 21KM1197 TaxID=2989734 RepID=UPI0029C9D476|nr:hypothetical protein [Corynebacterium sp. 21KM1197]WPF68093.1 hypothetical protein OLW90_08430 [Corynebacterium sp. 21KM1197]